MGRPRHPKKEIEMAIRHAEAHRWVVSFGGSHAWGKMYCPFNSPDCRCGEFCVTSIWSTPRNPVNHARHLMRVVDRCLIRQRGE